METKRDPRQPVLKLLKATEVCERLAIGRTHLHNLVRSGKIKPVHIGKRGVRYSEAEIERYIQENSGGQGGNN